MTTRKRKTHLKNKPKYKVTKSKKISISYGDRQLSDHVSFTHIYTVS